jgi:hypothetical protein
VKKKKSAAKLKWKKDIAISSIWIVKVGNVGAKVFQTADQDYPR